MADTTEDIIQSLNQVNTKLEGMLNNNMYSQMAWMAVTQARVGSLSRAGVQAGAGAFGTPSPNTTPTERSVALMGSVMELGGQAAGAGVALLSKAGPIGTIISAAVGDAAGQIASAILKATTDAEVQAEKLTMKASQEVYDRAAELGIEITDDQMREIVRHIKKVMNRRVRTKFLTNRIIDKAQNPYAHDGALEGWATAIRPI